MNLRMNLGLTEEEIKACKIARKVLKRVEKQDHKLMKKFDSAYSSGNVDDVSVLSDIIKGWHINLYKKYKIDINQNVGVKIDIH